MPVHESTKPAALSFCRCMMVPCGCWPRVCCGASCPGSRRAPSLRCASSGGWQRRRYCSTLQVGPGYSHALAGGSSRLLACPCRWCVAACRSAPSRTQCCGTCHYCSALRRLAKLGRLDHCQRGWTSLRRATAPGRKEKIVSGCSIASCSFNLK